MTDAGWAPAACTLPTAERPLRVAEFDALFADHLVAVDRVAPERLRLSFGGGEGVARTVRDLTHRESECCSFFTFGLARDGDQVILDITVPAAQIEVLDALTLRASEAVS